MLVEAGGFRKKMPVHAHACQVLQAGSPVGMCTHVQDALRWSNTCIRHTVFGFWVWSTCALILPFDS